MCCVVFDSGVMPCGQPCLQGCSAFSSARYLRYPRAGTISQSFTLISQLKGLRCYTCGTQIHLQRRSGNLNLRVDSFSVFLESGRDKILFLLSVIYVYISLLSHQGCSPLGYQFCAGVSVPTPCFMWTKAFCS